ncbi:MAG: DMT family transporter [Verrucomicrobiales bacterium]|nr:DMT family transporter [Verrucomicrobiales bacterium]
METESSSYRRGILLALMSIVLFAANVLLLRALSLAVPSIDGHVASVFRGLVGWVVIVLAFRGRGFEPRRLLTSPMLLMRGLVGAAGILLFYVTISHLGAGRAVILNLTYPIFGAVMAAAWLKESLGLRQLGWMLVGLAGLGLFFAGSAFEGGLTRYEGLALIGAVVAGAAVVLIRVLSRSEHASTIYASQCLWSFAAGLPLGASPIVDLPVAAVAGLVVASVLVSGGQLALTQSFRALSVAKGSSIQMLMPLATSTGGMLFFGERYATLEWVGALITVAATWQVVRNPVARSA